MEYIKKNIIETLKLKNKKPFQKIKILDVGCGGGLLSEPMSRMGAEVTGIDASEKNINIAKIHSKQSGLKIKYFVHPQKNLNQILNLM